MAYVPLLSEIFGQKPEVAGFQDVNLGDEQLKSILENLKAFEGGDIQKLGSLYQDYMTGLYSNLIPNYKDILKKGGAVTGDLLDKAGAWSKGELDPATLGNIYRSSAYQNLGSGLLGSPAGAANTARNLGLGTMDVIKQGANLEATAGNAAQRWAALAGGTILPTSSFLVNPQQQFEATTQNRLIQRQVQQERYNVAAAPNPIAKGLSDLVAYLTASYIGRGPAGKPPSAPSYATSTGSSDVLNPGYYTDSATTGGQGSMPTNSYLPPDTGVPSTAFDYGVGYPSSDPNAYYPYGGSNPYGSGAPVSGAGYSYYPGGAGYPADTPNYTYTNVNPFNPFSTPYGSGG